VGGQRYTTHCPARGDGDPTDGETETQRYATGSHSADGNAAQSNKAQPNAGQDQATYGKAADCHQPDGKVADRDYAPGYTRQSSFRVHTAGNVDQWPAQDLSL
jgi:hypothetical protein